MSEARRALPPTPHRWALRMGTVAVVTLAIAILLAAYVVTTRSGTEPQPNAPLLAPAPAPAPAPSVTASRSSGPQMILDENFDGPELEESIWNTCHWWNDEGCTISSNDELEWYRPEQVSISEGVLRLTADREPFAAPDGKTYEFRSGMVTTGPPEHEADPKLAFTYGSVEARLRIPSGRGLWSAMWMLPVGEDSRPEIDILEALGNDPGEMIMHLHPKDRDVDSPDKRHRLASATSNGGWHTIRLDWTPGRLRFFADGVEVWRLNGEQVPAEPMYLVFNLAVGGAYPGPPDEKTRFPSTFAIDYVKVAAAP